MSGGGGGVEHSKEAGSARAERRGRGVFAKERGPRIRGGSDLVFEMRERDGPKRRERDSVRD